MGAPADKAVSYYSLDVDATAACVIDMHYPPCHALENWWHATRCNIGSMPRAMALVACQAL